MGLQACLPPGDNFPRPHSSFSPGGVPDHERVWALPAVCEASPPLQLAQGGAFEGSRQLRIPQLPLRAAEHAVADRHQHVHRERCESLPVCDHRLFGRNRRLLARFTTSGRESSLTAPCSTP